MSDTLASLHRKIESSQELESVVRTMKAIAASSISQYERAVESLADYYRTVEFGLAAAFRSGQGKVVEGNVPRRVPSSVDAIVFGSDQGLVGQFNDVITAFVSKTLATQKGPKRVWAVGERVCGNLEDAGLKSQGLFPTPTSVTGITQLVGQVLVAREEEGQTDELRPLYLFHNRPKTGAVYEPAGQRLLPLDESWFRQISAIRWPTDNLPETVGDHLQTTRALVREYLFVSLFKACAESLASENASRLAAMQRAEKNIDDLLEDSRRQFHHLRQSSIDEELFDLISGFEALKPQGPSPRTIKNRNVS